MNEDISLDANIRRYKEVKEYFEKYPELKKLVPQITGTTSALGVHAGGIIISDKKYPLAANIGLQKQSEGLNATCWTKDEVAQLGYIKYDLLGLGAAGQVHLCKQLLGQDPYKLYPFNLDDVFNNTVLKGNNNNIFQFESNLGKQCFIELLPMSIDDLSNASGLIRVLGSDEGRTMYKAYKENVTDLQSNPHGDPLWEERLRDEAPLENVYNVCHKVLAKTYGILIYQEQLCELVRDLSNGDKTFVDGNNVRKMLGKLLKNHGYLQDLQGNKEALKKWHDDFMKVFNTYFKPYLPAELYTDEDHVFLGFQLDENVQLKVPSKGIVNWLVMCSVYIFSRLHSVAYSINSYEQLYQKHYHQNEFWLSVLICDYNSAEDIQKDIAAIRSETNIEVLPPDINISNFFFTPEGNNIRFGLGSIMALGKSAKALVEIRKNGKFKDLEDLLKRIKGNRAITSKTIKNLLFCGAFASFGKTKDLIAYLEANEIKSIDFTDEEKDVNQKAVTALEYKLIGCNLTYLDPIMMKAKQYTAYNAIEDDVPTFMAIKVVKNMAKKTKTGKDYIMNIVTDLNSNKNFNVFNWDKKEFKEGESSIIRIKKRGDFVSLCK